MRRVLAVAYGAAAIAAAEQNEETVTKPYIAPDVEGLHFAETFDGEVWSRWSACTAEKYNGKFDVSLRAEEALLGDLGLKVPEEAKHYGAAVKFDPITVDDQGSFAVQFEAKFEEGLTCGGSYIKLFDSQGQPSTAFKDDTRYVIMFGPDKCGETSKVHFILQHQNPVTEKWEEKHLKSAPSVPGDRRTHLYSLFIRSDNTFEVQVDGEKKAGGSLLTSMEPPINPPKEIDDPSDKKPTDWVDESKMDDPEAKKPDDWDEDQPYQIPDPSASMPTGWLEDEPLKIADPSAKRPEDWDDEEDGEWEAPIIANPACNIGCGKWIAPKINNPAYKGKWYAPKIDNPAYKGVWSPRQIQNPDYFVDESPYKLPKIDSVGIDIWTMNKGIVFDNIVVDSNPEKVAAFGQKTYRVRSDIEAKQDKKASGGDGFVQKIMDVVSANPVATIVTCVALVIGLLVFCLRGSAAPPPPERAEPVATRKRSDSPPKQDKDKDKSGDSKEEKASSSSSAGASTEGAKAEKKEGGLGEALASDS
eukprot:TRINITY_DN44304_c0_g1_i1.p1 TRINITY_DN44304_c0_g1~~TRINITY_DN44304_c0_g1_i1.p1  ORF type:complete len:559 (+),score=141.26 TRINITY_DN44304_c0_g1_i1:89-1678(+)